MSFNEYNLILSSVISDKFADTLTASRIHTDKFDSIDDLQKAIGENFYIQGLDTLEKDQVLKDIQHNLVPANHRHL